MRKASDVGFSSNDLEKELQALDRKIQAFPTTRRVPSSATEYSYETESDDNEIDEDDNDDSDSDEVDIFQLPKIYDPSVDVDQIGVIQTGCRGFLARLSYHQLLKMRNERITYVNELASSEAVFVLSLQYLCTYFLAPMKEESLYKEDKIIQSMFSTLEELRAADMDWLQSLQVLAANWNLSSEIGTETDKLQSDFLPIYNFYCSNYLHLIHWLQQQQHKNPGYVKLEKKCCEELQRNTTIATNFQVLLSLPLTNLRSFHVIFENLLSCTEPSHVDYPKIQECIDQLKNVANLAATSVKDIENKQKILAMEETLSGELPVKTWVAPNRIFIMEGYLTKLCRKVAKKRYFWLLSDCLIYAIPSNSEKEKEKKKEMALSSSSSSSSSSSLSSSSLSSLSSSSSSSLSTSSSLSGSSGSVLPPEKKTYRFRRMLPLLNSRFINLADDPSRQPHAFQIVTAPKSFIVFASTEDQKLEWLCSHDTALNIISSRGTAVKVKTDTSKMAPIWLHDNMSTTCMVCRKSFNVVKRRHHCRKCGKLVCGGCSQKKIMLSNLGKAKRVCDECYRSLGETGAESPRATASKSPKILSLSSSSSRKNSLRGSKGR